MQKRGRIPSVKEQRNVQSKKKQILICKTHYVNSLKPKTKRQTLNNNEKQTKLKDLNFPENRK